MSPTIPLPSETPNLSSVAAALNASDHSGRMAWMRSLGRRELQLMYRLADGGPSLEASHFSGAPGAAVIHHGQNSLMAFNSFQKRVVDNGGELQGYNHQTMSWVTGPGHFVLEQDGPEVLFDYTRLPRKAFEGFPPLRNNAHGFSALVYGQMVDRVRRVSDHCVIGAAFKKGAAMNAWFMLIREGANNNTN